MAGFTHLHLHTTYSLLDGQCGIGPLVAKAKALGMTSVAVTDHGNLYALKAFYDEARKAEVVAAWTKRYSAPDDATLAQLKVGMQGSYEELRKATDSMLAPVGKAFFTVGDKLDLHSDEGDQKPHHPNPRGTYLAGCVFFKTITGKSPIGLWQKLAAADKAPKVEEGDAKYLEEIADKVVE